MTIIGSQTPRLLLAPQAPGGTDYADHCIELAESVGLILDPWQKLVLRVALSVRADLRWSAFELGLIVSRQNGKGSILEARMLAGLFIFGESLQLYSSHEFKTSLEMFQRLVALVTNSDALRKRVKKIPTSHGEEGIELLRTAGQNRGNRCRFVARSSGSGRGFTADAIYFDEAYNLSSTTIAAMMPTLSTVLNPQIWYTSSAGWEISTALADVRNRAIAADPEDAALGFLEWSAPDVGYDVDSPEHLAMANPALGIRITMDFCQKERKAMKGDLGRYAMERLGVGQWPVTAESWSVIPEMVWSTLVTQKFMVDPVVFAVDVTPDRSFASIGAAGTTADGEPMVELVAHGAGTSWVTERLTELLDKHRTARGVVVSPRGPAGSLLADIRETLEKTRKEKLLLTPTGQEEAQACSALYDASVDSMSLRHRGQDPIASALAGASRKVLTEGAWSWNRKAVTVDISPLWAVTLALWGHRAAQKRKREPFILVGS